MATHPDLPTGMHVQLLCVDCGRKPGTGFTTWKRFPGITSFSIESRDVACPVHRTPRAVVVQLSYGEDV